MSSSEWRERQHSKESSHTGDAADTAAAAAFLEMAERLGVLDLIMSGLAFRASDVAARARLGVDAAHRYMTALLVAGLVDEDPLDAGSYRATPAIPLIAHRAGYVGWAMSANRTMVDNVRDFLADPDAARRHREGESHHAALAMDWMAWLALNPSVVNVMLAARARRFVDLQARTGRLLVDSLARLPDCVGIGFVADGDSRRSARATAEAADVQDRLTLLERPVRSLLDDPSVISGGDVVHAGAAFHELLPDRDALGKVLALCRSELRPGGILVLTELVPPPYADHERLFGSLTLLYAGFQGHLLLPEEQWSDELNDAGFTDIEVRPLGLPAARLIVAHA